MGLIYTGTTAFNDACAPANGKSEWGMDTLTREMAGARPLLAAYIASLAQGATYSYNGVTYYLQTWEPDKHPVWATVILNYKGLSAGIPSPVVVNDIQQSSGQLSADFHTQNDGKGINYGVAADGTQLYAIGAICEFSYYAGITIYRYIASSSPSGSSHSSLGFTWSAPVIRSRITTSDGSVFGGNAPSGLVTALSIAAAAETVAIAFNSQPVFGTPYFECQDVVRKGYASS